MTDALLSELLARHLADCRSGWSCGSFGAIGEFVHDEGEAVEFAQAPFLDAITARGAIRIDPKADIRAIAYEMTSRDADCWQHGLALCLPESDCAMGRRTVVTELGPDVEALRPQDRTAILFDLGLDLAQADACIRTGDEDLIAHLRAGAGRALLEPGNPLIGEILRHGPHRVFRCRFGRIEIYQPIPSAGECSPDGPHSHVLPDLLAHRRSHAANLPLPDGWVPCMTLFPPNPVRDAQGQKKSFDRTEHDAFQHLWRRFGDPDLVAVKEAALALDAPREPATRAERTVLRVAERQAAYLR